MFTQLKIGVFKMILLRKSGVVETPYSTNWSLGTGLVVQNDGLTSLSPNEFGEADNSRFYRRKTSKKKLLCPGRQFFAGRSQTTWFVETSTDEKVRKK